MYCADLERVHLAVLDASGFKEFTVERDDQAIDQLVSAATEVMGHVGRGEWPPSVLPDPPVRHSDRVLELDAAGIAELEHWLSVKADLAEVESLEEAAKQRLVHRLGDAQAATVDGAVVLTYRSHTRSNVDLTRLRAEHPDIVAELTVESVVRVLRPTRSP
jgi:predicted phage-related endonuclease